MGVSELDFGLGGNGGGRARGAHCIFYFISHTPE